MFSFDLIGLVDPCEVLVTCSLTRLYHKTTTIEKTSKTYTHGTPMPKLQTLGSVSGEISTSSTRFRGLESSYSSLNIPNVGSARISFLGLWVSSDM